MDLPSIYHEYTPRLNQLHAPKAGDTIKFTRGTLERESTLHAAKTRENQLRVEG